MLIHTLLISVLLNIPSALCQFLQVAAAIGQATASGTGQGSQSADNLKVVTPPPAMADANIANFLAGDRNNTAFSSINSQTPLAPGFINSASGPAAGPAGMTNSDGFTAFTSGGGDMGSRPGYGGLSGYDYGRDIPNAGYGGYPGRGGYSGYWEPGVRPIPLAMQGWSLSIPRPPVEITTPTTTATTRPPTTAAPTTTIPSTTTATSTTTTTTRPLSTTTTTLPPTTASPSTVPTTRPPTTTPSPIGTSTTMLPYSINNPSYNGNRMRLPMEAKLATLPEVLVFNGQKVIVTPMDDDKEFQAMLDSNSAMKGFKVSDDLKSSHLPELTVSNPEAFEQPTTCVPVTTSSTTGQCVPNSLLQIACSNMIVAASKDCKKDSWCCYIENR
ncbi:uncharacterized protein LOC129597660 [Paramacrobiotus metropolitanus]|uniref:uncharacterized protein LOC129597660 n=1 Tax=Paramacrobiotus metropolitanus TaxID=2943436 RepID=UPI002446322D|nr:uncharacterized protein LOC129597660 [Paramacrobiotus metropolitanus]